MIPSDRFTPHGYLDNPHHSRNLNPSGVVRSLPGIGFAWHFPALPRGYGFQEIYRAGIRLYLALGDRVLIDPEDLPGLHATRHTKNEKVFVWAGAGIELEASFFLASEHALACRIRLNGRRDQAVRVGALACYTRHLGASGVWGESGLVGRVEGDAVVLQGFEDGEAFALSATPAPHYLGASVEPKQPFLAQPMLEGDHVVTTGGRGETVELQGAVAVDVPLAGDSAKTLEFLLCRDIRRDLALRRLEAVRPCVPLALSRHRESDEAFWRDAPRLSGDWPDHWRRGLVYDFETLRMMVREPLGIYRHRWDAMQIQAPRVVLAEAAIDALLLSYGDLTAAKEILLGAFLDAPAPNVPCSREDGTYNMVSANGSACGTAPEWGYPVRVAAHLYDSAPDDAWLEALLPPLEDFLFWWEENRRDEEGYLVYDNSWESGQDLSGRFGPQKEGGGSTIRMVRPVDLQASMADACRHLARFSRILGRDPGEWERRVEHYQHLTERAWRGDGYRDHDARVGWSDVWDVMQLAPVALGLAPDGHIDAVRETVLRLADDPYLWPMFVWTATDAALAAGEQGVAARIATDTIERAWSTWDRPTAPEDGPLPGVTCEYWGTDGRNGAEGYGWGAFGLHLLFRTLLGYRPRPGGFELMPNLPEDWRAGRYVVENLRAAGCCLDLAIRVDVGAIHLQVATRDGSMLRFAGVDAPRHDVKVPRGKTEQAAGGNGSTALQFEVIA